MNSYLEKSIDSWILWLESEKRVSKNTLKSYQIDLKSFFQFLKKFENCEIGIENIKFLDETSLRGWFFSRIKENVSPRSNARALSSIKSFLSYLVKSKVIKSSKILTIKGPKFQESLPRPLNEKQIEKIFLLDKDNKPDWIIKRNKSIFLLMWGYGLRISEVLNIKFKEVKNSEHIVIMGKGNKERLIPLFTELKDYILKMIKKMPFILTNEDFIFLGQRGKKLNPRVVQREMKQIRNRYHLPENTTPHSLRHTFATQLLDKKVDLRTIQELLGHESLSTTQKYTAVDVSKLKDTIENFHPRSKKKL